MRNEQVNEAIIDIVWCIILLLEDVKYKQKMFEILKWGWMEVPNPNLSSLVSS